MRGAIKKYDGNLNNFYKKVGVKFTERLDVNLSINQKENFLKSKLFNLEIVNNKSILPTCSELRKFKLGNLVNIIYELGGFKKVAENFNLKYEGRASPNTRNKDLVLVESKQIILKLNRMFDRDDLVQLNKKYLDRAIQKRIGGYEKLAREYFYDLFDWSEINKR